MSIKLGYCEIFKSFGISLRILDGLQQFRCTKMGIFTIFVISPFFNIKIILKYKPFDRESNSLSSQVYLNIFSIFNLIQIAKKAIKGHLKILKFEIHLSSATDHQTTLFFFYFKEIKILYKNL